MDSQKYYSERKNKFSRLVIYYILALVTIATVIIIGQALIQNFLADQLSDSRVINVAGRQRMLSQKISKLSLLIEHEKQPQLIEEHAWELLYALDLWEICHEGLKHGNDTLNLPGNNEPEISNKFIELDKHFKPMLLSARELLILCQSKESTKNLITSHVEAILTHEKEFLTRMDEIVFMYDDLARKKVSMLSQTEYLLLLISLVVIICEIFFIFKPTAKKVNKTLNQLVDSKQHAQAMTKEIGALYHSLELSYKKISAIDTPVEIPRLLAKADRGGNLKSVSAELIAMAKLSKEQTTGTISDILPSPEFGEEFMDDLIEIVSEGDNWQGEVHYKIDKPCWLELTITPVFNQSHEVTELLILGSNLTQRRLAEQNMQQQGRDEIERRINEQKFRSVLILEGQEEERKRIAMDLHDGIGQMLTSLKFQIEAMQTDDAETITWKVEELKALAGDIIKEVRKITFNLKPTVLGDYGISAAIGLFVKEISKLTDQHISFHNPQNFNRRLPSNIENNLFRITQEAINNAIKYAGNSDIQVKIEEIDSNLIITVKDEGPGFDPEKIRKASKSIEKGHGLFNMFERTAYINGEFDIETAPGKGTTVTLRFPL